MSISIGRDLRSRFGAIRDQGSRPTCLAFAVSDAHAVARGPFDPLSVEQLYYHAVQRTPGGDPAAGVNLPAILAAYGMTGRPLKPDGPTSICSRPISRAGDHPPVPCQCSAANMILAALPPIP